jgi:uncharacterized protein with FMN-binding domain
MWKRPAIATLLITVALALLLSFKTPYVTPTAANGGNGAGSTASISSSYSGRLTGNTVNTPYGPVQVQITIQSGAITDVQALQMPSGGGHTGQITAYAGPQLRSEALAAQSAAIDSISGATYTSQGYIQSLQSALDQIPK